MSRKTIPLLLSRHHRKLRRLSRDAARLRLARAMILPISRSLGYSSVSRRVFVSECAECGRDDCAAGADAGCGSCLAAMVCLS